MKYSFSFVLLFVIMAFNACKSDNSSKKTGTITISGRVTDFDGAPIDSSIVKLMHKDFSSAYETYTDKEGYYSLESVEKGQYKAMYVLRPKEYPRENAVPKEDMRLEFWGWNIIADKDLTINPRYHKLELYGTTAYEIYGGNSGLFVYFRPMSVTKYLSYAEEIFLNKASAEAMADISVKPEHLKVEIYADDELLKINSIQPIEEYAGEGNHPLLGYIIQTSRPNVSTDKPYIIIKVVAENEEFKEKGENIFFYEPRKFK